MIRDSRAKYRARAAAAERSVDAAVAEVKAAEAAEAEARAAEYAKRIAPVPFTPEELAVARVVRTRFGWARLIRVNAKSVTIAGAFGDDRIPVASVLEVRA
jgi:hypothetical protein